MSNPEPVSAHGVPRMAWILLCMMILPSVLAHFGLSPVSVVAVTGLCGIAAVFPLRTMNCRKPSSADSVISVTAGIGIILLSGVLTFFAKYVLTALHIHFAERQALAAMIGWASPVEILVLFLAVCILTPVIEEVLFRRLIYGLWSDLHRRTAFCGTALLFAAIHFFPVGFPGLFVMGLGFQWLCNARRNLTCAMIAHCVVNIFAFGVNLYLRKLN